MTKDAILLLGANCSNFSGAPPPLDSPLDCLPGKSVTVSTPLLNTGRGPHGDRLEPTISEQIAALQGMNKQQLLARWKENFGKAAPVHLRKQLMVPVLAYRIQEREYGGLSQVARNRLRELAESFESKASPKQKGMTEDAAENGSRFVRSWHGEIYEVLVKPDGFAYRGRLYGSLSRIAREITGTRWSGPLFFGLRKPAR